MSYKFFTLIILMIYTVSCTNRSANSNENNSMSIVQEWVEPLENKNEKQLNVLFKSQKPKRPRCYIRG